MKINPSSLHQVEIQVNSVGCSTFHHPLTTSFICRGISALVTISYSPWPLQVPSCCWGHWVQAGCSPVFTDPVGKYLLHGPGLPWSGSLCWGCAECSRQGVGAEHAQAEVKEFMVKAAGWLLPSFISPGHSLETPRAWWDWVPVQLPAFPPLLFQSPTPPTLPCGSQISLGLVLCFPWSPGQEKAVRCRELAHRSQNKLRSKHHHC